MNASLARAALASLLGCAAAASGRAQGVRIVTPGGSPVFPGIQAAVDAAADGDALLVAEGDYGGFTIDGKSLAIHAIPGADVRVKGMVRILNVGALQTVVLDGLHASGGGDETVLMLSDAQGIVRLQDRSFLGSYPAFGFWCIPEHGAPGAEITDCPQVAFLACQLQGSEGQYQDSVNGACQGGDGGAGLLAVRAGIALYECEVTGGEGGTAKYLPGPGGPGLAADDATVLASGGYVHGGPGGLGYGMGASYGSDGVALELSASSTFYGLECHLDGSALVGGPGAYVVLPGHARSLGSLAVVPASRPLALAYVGQPDDVVWLPLSTAPGHTLLLAASGVWLMQLPFSRPPTPAGVAPASGATQLALGLPDLPFGAPWAAHVVQGLVEAPTDGRALTSARQVLLLSPTLGPDCDASGLSDYLEIALGLAPDANHNLIPDGCPGG